MLYHSRLHTIQHTLLAPSSFLASPRQPAQHPGLLFLASEVSARRRGGTLDVARSTSVRNRHGVACNFPFPARSPIRDQGACLFRPGRSPIRIGCEKALGSTGVAEAFAHYALVAPSCRYRTGGACRATLDATRWGGPTRDIRPLAQRSPDDAG